jgi:hypothetical protein
MRQQSRRTLKKRTRRSYNPLNLSNQTYKTRSLSYSKIWIACRATGRKRIRVVMTANARISLNLHIKPFKSTLNKTKTLFSFIKLTKHYFQIITLALRPVKNHFLT